MLREHAKLIRQHTVRCIASIGVGHIGGCLSIADLLAVLYFDVMNTDPQKPDMKGRDWFIMSKGHAGPALYATLALKGYFPLEQLMTLNKEGTRLPSHCDMRLTVGVDMTAGSLAQGFSCAVGLAKAAKIMGGKEYFYAVIGDGESQEGQIWEASMAAAHFKLDNLISFLDYNRYQLDGPVDEIMSLIDPVEKWRSFGFNVYSIDGHDVGLISDTILLAKAKRDEKPTMIVLNTVKGKGVSFVENAGAGNHNMKIDEKRLAEALAEIEREA
jgi:transketolase